MTIGASEKEWSTAKVGLISLVADKSYTKLEWGRFVELINQYGKETDLFDPIRIRKLDPRVSFENQVPVGQRNCN